MESCKSAWNDLFNDNKATEFFSWNHCQAAFKKFSSAARGRRNMSATRLN